MKFIIVDNHSGKSRSFSANGLLLGLTFVGLLGIPATISYLSYLHGVGEAAQTAEMFGKWREALKDQDRQIEIASRDAQDNLEASALRLAKLQARIVRLDALGERLTAVAKLDVGEFDFSQPPAMGGPVVETGVDITPSNYLTQLSQLAADIENRERQLGVLETLIVDRKMKSDVFLAGRPALKGWMSSRFGMRNDPVTGRRVWHNGVDFAGKEGADVVTVAAGVVVFAGDRNGYGEMVEVNHGNGFSTRYGHHKELLVKVGDIVKKGQIVGLMGSSGRSTGPHVHFEVFKNGRVVDPSSYIHRASR
ncbi:MAG TPA: M23 family metallopeptidase [Pseudomonadales bacterium]|jgi:murein DD-endopeptidase MepM/ murein hydrolase activator NlpD|nr:M23 family metallopeptidase [Pseudomonadales bacterium]MDP7313951.1 M23 family metallopeptidase [Pseudomonadales bacterium]HJP50057.1 M23 family metallopeptidase [Pseudomonadales bacterium]|tara:strand:+ start:6682 stop:7602 length:921 start_codon:yes stop_codon:yes gene_type:complete